MSATASSLAELFPHASHEDTGETSLLFDPRNPDSKNPFAAYANSHRKNTAAPPTPAAGGGDLSSLANEAGSNFGSIPLSAALTTLIRKGVVSDSQMTDFSVTESVKAVIFHMLMSSSDTETKNKGTQIPEAAAAFADRCCPLLEVGKETAVGGGAIQPYNAEVMAFLAVHMLTLDDPKISSEWLRQLTALWSMGLSNDDRAWPNHRGFIPGGPEELKSLHRQHQLGACIFLTSFMRAMPSIVNFAPRALPLGIPSFLQSIATVVIPYLRAIISGSGGGSGALSLLQIAAMEALLSAVKKLYSTIAESLTDEAQTVLQHTEVGGVFNALFSRLGGDAWERDRKEGTGGSDHPLDDEMVWGKDIWLYSVTSVVGVFIAVPEMTPSPHGSALNAILKLVETKVGCGALADLLDEERSMLLSRSRGEISGSQQRRNTDALLCAVTQRLAISATHIATGALESLKAALSQLTCVPAEEAIGESPPHDHTQICASQIAKFTECSQEAVFLIADSRILSQEDAKSLASLVKVGEGRSHREDDFALQLRTRMEQGIGSTHGLAHIRRTSAATGLLIYFLQHAVALSQFTARNNQFPPSDAHTHNWLLLNALVFENTPFSDLFPSRVVAGVKECVLRSISLDCQLRGVCSAFSVPVPVTGSFIRNVTEFLSSTSLPSCLVQAGTAGSSGLEIVKSFAACLAFLVQSSRTSHLASPIIAELFIHFASGSGTYTVDSIAILRLLFFQVFEILAATNELQVSFKLNLAAVHNGQGSPAWTSIMDLIHRRLCDLLSRSDGNFDIAKRLMTFTFDDHNDRARLDKAAQIHFLLSLAHSEIQTMSASNQLSNVWLVVDCARRLHTLIPLQPDESSGESSVCYCILVTVWDALFLDQEAASVPTRKFRTPGDVGASFVAPCVAPSDLLHSSSMASESPIPPPSAVLVKLVLDLALSFSCEERVPSSVAKWVVSTSLLSVGDLSGNGGMARWIPISNALQKNCCDKQREEGEQAPPFAAFLCALYQAIQDTVQQQLDENQVNFDQEKEMESWNLRLCAPLLCVRNLTFETIHEISMSDTKLPKLLLRIALSKWNESTLGGRVSPDVRRLCGETVSRLPIPLWVASSGWLDEVKETSSHLFSESPIHTPSAEKLLSLCFVLCAYLDSAWATSTGILGDTLVNLREAASVLTPLLVRINPLMSNQSSHPLAHLMFAVRDTICHIQLHRLLAFNASLSAGDWEFIDRNEIFTSNFCYFLQIKLSEVEKRLGNQADVASLEVSLDKIADVLRRFVELSLLPIYPPSQTLGDSLRNLLHDISKTDRGSSNFTSSLSKHVGCLALITKIKVIRCEVEGRGGINGSGNEEEVARVLNPFMVTSGSHATHHLNKMAEEAASLSESSNHATEAQLLGNLALLVAALVNRT